MSQNPRMVIAAVDFAIIDENGIVLRCDNLEETRDSLAWEIRRIPFSNLRIQMYTFAFTE